MRAEILRPIVVLSGVTVVALVARLTWAAWTSPVPPWLSDADYYNATALSISRGEGYSVLFDGSRGWLPGGDATSFWPPGFSAYLALFYRLFGEHLVVARTANAVVGALTVIPVYFIGRRLFDEGSASIGAVLAAVMPSLVFWSPVLLSDTLFTFLFAGGVALLLHSSAAGVGDRGRVSIAMVVLLGVTVGLSALVRGQGVVLIPLALAWWLISRVSVPRVMIASMVVGVAAAVTITPWTIRNVAVFDSPIVLSTNLGYNLRIGHAPYSTGRYIVPHDLWDADPGMTFKERELLFDDLGQRRALDYAGGNLHREIALSIDKIEWLWRPDSDVLVHVSSYGRTPLPAGAWEPLRLALDVSYLAVLVLAGLSVFRFAEFRRGLVWSLLLLVTWTAIHVVFFGEPRYHLPVLSVLAPMAGATLIRVGERLRSRAWLALV